MKALLLAAAVAAAAPVLAQDLTGGLGQFHPKFVPTPQPAPLAAPTSADGLRSTLTALRDGIAAGGTVAEFIDSNHVAIEFKAQSASSSRVAGKPAKVLLSDALPAYPRVLGPLIASEVSGLIDEAMPACAEKEYMRLSRQARVWLELGGDPKSLPAIETLDAGYRDEALSKELKRWIYGYQDPEGVVSDLAAAAKLPTLADLKSKAKDTAEKSRLAWATTLFTTFTTEELSWARVAKGTVALP